MTSEMIIKAVIKAIKSLYPTHALYFEKLLEDAKYPCWLLTTGLQTVKVQNTDMLKKALTLDLIYFNSNKDTNAEDCMKSVLVRDNVQAKLLDSMYLNVNGTMVGMGYTINNVDGLLGITLKLTYFNTIVKESIDAELIQEIILNYK